MKRRTLKKRQYIFLRRFAKEKLSLAFNRRKKLNVWAHECARKYAQEVWHEKKIGFN